jgi:hypothetical protein
MRRSLYASTAIHAAILLWVAFGGTLFRGSPEMEFEVTGVTILSVSEFEAMTAGVEPKPVVLETPVAPPQAEESAAPDAPAPEEAPPPVEQPEEAPEPAPDTQPEPPAPEAPQTEVTDQIAALPTPSGAPDLPPSERPTPREAPRVAPVPAPAPEPDVETAPEVLDQPVNPDTSDAPAEEAPQTAPEEATTEIVTEAETPSGGPVAPVASLRPPPRPARPTPPAQPTETAAPSPEPEPTPQPEPETDPLADAIASAVADANATQTAQPAAPSGPALTQGVRDGFRIAVQACWNVGALSTEALGTTVVVAFDMGRDGVPVGSSLRLLEFSGGSETAAQQAYEAARRAVIRCGANGYDLPEESYDRWRQVELVFNPEGMRLR